MFFQRLCVFINESGLGFAASHLLNEFNLANEISPQVFVFMPIYRFSLQKKFEMSHGLKQKKLYS